MRTIAIIGLGYVGLPLSLALDKNYSVIGFDVNSSKIQDLKSGVDITKHFSFEDLTNSKVLFTNNEEELKSADVFIVCVPTPIDNNNTPDLSFIISSAKLVGRNMKKGAIVVYESTVYPGVTEEVVVPILEKESGSKYQLDFSVGYSPERVNPGDKNHTIDKITKVVSASNSEALKILEEVYSSFTKVHLSPSIKVAEAGKVIENIQRDLNIALVNELTLLFDRLDIDVHQVLEVAGTKWNFHKYTPGLVGGHCIGVDPYYLTHKAMSVGFNPEIILAGRRINDEMHHFLTDKIIKRLHKIPKNSNKYSVLILGLTFKKNVPDFRNSRIKHLITDLHGFSVETFAYDPYVSLKHTEEYFNTTYAYSSDVINKVDLVVLAVEHDELIQLAKTVNKDKLFEFFKN